MVTVEELFKKIAARQFLLADARELIKRSYYFANNRAHPDVHIVLAGQRRPQDLHFHDVAPYGNRPMHSMFPSMDDAAGAIAAALNCRAGEAALRFLSISNVLTVAVYSRTGAGHASTMLERLTTPGATPNARYVAQQTSVVIVVLSIEAEQVFVTTAYPCHTLSPDDPVPPLGYDLVRYLRGQAQQIFTYTAE
jgi:hypothetical protein